jgi:cell division septum initiation protein DivIVA
MDAERSAIAAQLQRAEQERARAEQHARTLQAQLESAPAAERPSFNSGTSAVMMMAQRTADDHLEDARRESEAMLNAARDQSAQITTEAQRSADDTEGDARRRHAEAISNLEIERAAVLDEIDRLRRLAESYQAALREHVEAQLGYMESAPEPAAGR